MKVIGENLIFELAPIFSKSFFQHKVVSSLLLCPFVWVSPCLSNINLLLQDIMNGERCNEVYNHVDGVVVILVVYLGVKEATTSSTTFNCCPI